MPLEPFTVQVISRQSSNEAFTPLEALSFMVFMLLYTPCLATLAIIKQEAGTKWAQLSPIYSLAMAWTASFIIYTVGNLLGWTQRHSSINPYGCEKTVSRGSIKGGVKKTKDWAALKHEDHLKVFHYIKKLSCRSFQPPSTPIYEHVRGYTSSP